MVFSLSLFLSPLRSEYFVNSVGVNPELSAKVRPNSKRIGPQCHHGQNGPIRSFQQDIAQEMRRTFCFNLELLLELSVESL